jgi:hypothetical protein
MNRRKMRDMLQPTVSDYKLCLAAVVTFGKHSAELSAN